MLLRPLVESLSPSVPDERALIIFIVRILMRVRLLWHGHGKTIRVWY